MKFLLFVVLFFISSSCMVVGSNWPFIGGGYSYSATNSSCDIIEILAPSNVVIASNGNRYTSVPLPPHETIRGRLSYNLTGTSQEVVLDYKRWSSCGRYKGHIAETLFIPPDNSRGT